MGVGGGVTALGSLPLTLRRAGPSLKDHLGGKKHRRRRSLRAERRSQQQRSLFVSGFARGTAAEELTEHFAAFGEVEAVVVDKEKVGAGGARPVSAPFPPHFHPISAPLIIAPLFPS